MSRLVLTGLLPVLLVASLEAQVPRTYSSETPTAPVVTETEFLSVLDAEHPAVVEASQAVALARARVVAASTLENPALAVVREDPSGPVEQTDWTISWQLPQSRRRPEIEARQAAVVAAEARLAQDLSSLRLILRQAYARWAVASQRRERLAAQAARVEGLAARESSRAERGEASGLEAHRLTLAASGLRARAALAAADADEARGRAKSWHPGLPDGAEPALPSLELLPEVLGDHPLLRAAQADLGAATLERQAAGRFVASPELVVGWQRQDAGTESLDGPILGLAWTVPLFGRNQAGRASSEARITAAQAHLETVRREVGAARAAASAKVQRLAEALAHAEAALAGNERMLAGAEAAFRQGEASLTDLLETLRSAAESEMTVLDLHEAALAAHRELEGLADSRSGPRPGIRGVAPDSTHSTHSTPKEPLP